MKSTRSCCLLPERVHGSSSRIDYFPRRETGASSSRCTTEIPVAPEAATLDPVAAVEAEWIPPRGSFVVPSNPRIVERLSSPPPPPPPPLLPSSPFRPLRVQESGTVLDPSVSTSSTSVRLRGRQGSASCRNVSTRCTCAADEISRRFRLDRAQIHPISS